jgi:methylthioxylose transferase
MGATRRNPLVCLGSDVVLGYCSYLSYGLVLVGILGLAVLALSHNWQALGWVVAGALLVGIVFTAYGFRWWDAYLVLH